MSEPTEKENKDFQKRFGGFWKTTNNWKKKFEKDWKDITKYMPDTGMWGDYENRRMGVIIVELIESLLTSQRNEILGEIKLKKEYHKLKGITFEWLDGYNQAIEDLESLKSKL